MTRRTEGNQISKMVSRFVIITKHPEWNNMMNVKRLTSLFYALSIRKSAMLTKVFVSATGLAPLRVPVWPVPVNSFSVNKERRVFAKPVFVSTGAAAILANTLRSVEDAFVNPKLLTTIQTSKFLRWSLWRACFDSRILTLWRTMLSSPMIKAPGFPLEGFSAMGAYQCNATSKHSLVGWLRAEHGLSLAGRRTILGYRGPIRLYFKWLTACLADYCFHSVIIPQEMG